MLGDGAGGGINNCGTLTLVGSTVSGNGCYSLAAASPTRGTATLRRSTISDNRAVRLLYAYSGRRDRQRRYADPHQQHRFKQRRAERIGGGVTLSSRGALTIDSSTVTGNIVALSIAARRRSVCRIGTLTPAALHRVRQYARQHGDARSRLAWRCGHGQRLQPVWPRWRRGRRGLHAGLDRHRAQQAHRRHPAATRGQRRWYDSARTRSRSAVRRSMRVRTTRPVRQSISAATRALAGRRATSVRSRVRRCSAMVGSRRWSAPTDPMR